MMTEIEGRQMRASYDGVTDVLYVSLLPVVRRVRSYDDPAGVVWRVAVDGDRVCGATIEGMHQFWNGRVDQLLELLSKRLPVDKSVIEQAVRPALT